MKKKQEKRSCFMEGSFMNWKSKKGWNSKKNQQKSKKGINKFACRKMFKKFS